jgi:hypothetical protein
MTAIEFPRRHIAQLHDLGARLLDSRKPKSDSEPLARALLAGFFDICMRAGLDRVLAELGAASPPLDIADGSGALADHPAFLPALVAQLGTSALDDGGPRNAKPRQLADCVVAALGLTLADEADRSVTLDDRVRTDAAAAIASVVDVELAVPQIRDAIIAKGRELCDEAHRAVYDKMAAQLDERGLTMTRQPKVPLHSAQAVQRAFAAARDAVIARAGRAAIDRAQEVIARADAAAAARIDEPVTLRLTPREGALLRACDPRVVKTPAHIGAALLDGISELARIAWRAPERVARPYAASQTFAIGELIQHPKFGRGTVVSRMTSRIEVEFADGKHTLAAVNPDK